MTVHRKGSGDRIAVFGYAPARLVKRMLAGELSGVSVIDRQEDGHDVPVYLQPPSPADAQPSGVGNPQSRLIGELDADYHNLKIRWFERPKYGTVKSGDKLYAVTPPDPKTVVPPQGFREALIGLVGTVYHRMNDDSDDLTADGCLEEARQLFARFFIDSPETCEWRDNGDDGWQSSCGKEFYFEDGTPSDNGMVYCMRCGKPAVEIGGDDIPERDGHDDAG